MLKALIFVVTVFTGCEGKIDSGSAAPPPCDPAAAECAATEPPPGTDGAGGGAEQSSSQTTEASTQTEKGVIKADIKKVAVDKGILAGLSLTKKGDAPGGEGSFYAAMSTSETESSLTVSIDFGSELEVSLPQDMIELLSDPAFEGKARFVTKNGETIDLTAMLKANPAQGFTVPGAGKLSVVVSKKTKVANQNPADPSVPGPSGPEADTVAPTIVGNLSVSSLTADSVSLTWQQSTDNATGDLSYQVYYSEFQDSASISEILQNWTSGSPAQINGLNLTVNGLLAGKRYTFVVIVADAAGNKAAYAPLSVHTRTAVPQAPVLTAAISSIEVAWPAVTNAASFNLYWSTSAGVSKTDSKISGVTSPYLHSAISSSQTYYYAAASVNGDGVESELGPESSATPYSQPGQPTYLLATPFDSSTIDLTWIDNTSDETGFEIERSPDGSAWTKVADVGANVVTWRNDSLTVSTEYFYRVRAKTSYGYSAFSNTAAGTPPVTGSGTYTASLSNSGHFDYECPDYGGDVWVNPGTATNLYLQVGSPGWCDDRSEAILRFTAIAIPRDAVIESAVLRVIDASTVANASTLQIGSHSVLSAAMPANFAAATVLSGQLDGTVSYADPSATLNAVSDFDVKTLMQKRVNDPAWSDGAGVIFTLRATSGWYRYFKDNVDLIVSYKVSTAKRNPINLDATVLGSREVQLDWLDQATIEDSLDIERSTDGINWSLAANVSANTITWKDYGLVKSTQYFYRMRAKTGSEYGDYTVPVSATTLAVTNETWTATDTDRYRWDYECPDYGGDVWGQGGFIQKTAETWCDADAGMFIRFRNMRLPAGAVIQSATLQLVCTGDDLDIVLKIFDSVSPDSVWPTGFADAITKRANTVAGKDAVFTTLPGDHRYDVADMVRDRIGNASWVINTSGMIFLAEATPGSAYGSRNCSSASLNILYE